MSNFEFVIPVSKEDLLKKTNVNDYVVEEVFPIRQLQFRLKNAENDFKNIKHAIILTHFDSFYSIIDHFQTVESDITTAGWRLIMKVMTSLTNSLHDLMAVERLEADDRNEHLNMVKMSSYILGQFIERFESESQNVAARNNANKTAKKKATSKSPIVDNWESEREVGVKAILQVVQLKVERLYDPPILEEEFISLLTAICYKVLETAHQQKSKGTRDYVFNILGIMVKKHGNSFSCVVRLLQLLQQNEQLITPMAQGIAMICEKYEAKAFVAEILREIGRVDAKELSKDSNSTKYFSGLLVELSRIVPEEVLQSIDEVIHLLDEESYTMRNGILGVFGELVVRLMNSNDLEDKMKVVRSQFLAHLQEHLHDANAFVRSRVLQIWQTFLEEQLDLVSHFSVLLPLINGRIQDKSSNVRKYAVQTIIKLMRSNECTLKMTAEGLQKNLSKEVAKLEQLQLEKQKRKNKAGGDDDDRDDDAVEKDDEEMERDVEDSSEEMDTSQNGVANGHHDDDDDGGEELAEVKRLKSLVEYLMSSLAFIKESVRSISLISLRLGSKVASDVIEAIEFLVTGYEAGLKECIVGVRTMLPLVFSKEKEVRDAVVEAYKGIYLEPKHDARMGNKDTIVAASLIALKITAETLGDKEALKELIEEFVRCDLLGDGVSMILLQKFTFKIPGTTPEESKAALELIGFIVSEQVELLEANLDILMRNGLENQDDYTIVMETCLVIMKLAAKKRAEDSYVLTNDHEVFGIIADIVVQGITKTERPNFIPMVERAIKTIYALAEKPDVVCTDIITRQVEIMSKSGREGDLDTTMTPAADAPLDNSQTPPPDFFDDLNLNASQSQTQVARNFCPSEMLTRFLSTCGHVAVQQFIYMDVVVYAEMKKQRGLMDKNSKKDSRKSVLSVQSASAAGSARLKREERTIEDELGLVGNTAEDCDAEFIKKVLEREIVTGGENLLSILEPIIVTTCSNQVKYSDPALSAVSSLALTKFMTVSSEYCESHLRLLFTILEKSPLPVVRSNIIISIGDLASRFPNQLEPWTSNIYNKLRDRSMDVRQNTLQVLTQLILNDMIKVKGQISEIALCTLDDDPTISYTAKMFFQEFAKKSNAIYNILPDVVSRLSDTESEVTEEQFQPIMKFLVSFIEKEKQSESLCEKLCHRIRATVEERQWRDLAYCLSLLPANEKSIKKLNENFACFADKLNDQYVLECMQTVVTNAKKFAKQDAKPQIDEFGERLVNHNKKRDDDNEGGASDNDDVVRSFLSSSGKKAKAPATAKKPKAGRKKTKSPRYDDDDGEDDDEDEEGDKTSKKNATKISGKAPLRKSGRDKIKAVLTFNSSEDELDF